MQDDLKVVYITSMGHSGSTLLDLLISAHSRVASVGEIKNLVSLREPGCSCQARTVWECPFWARVGRVFEASTGVPLRQARILDDADPEYGTHNRELFRAVAGITGKNVIVDSSKSTERLRRLLRSGAVELFVIHLVRGPQGVAYSFIRKGRSWPRIAFRHGRRAVQVERLLGDHPRLTIAYEDLAERPVGVLETVMQTLGLSFEPGQLRWAERERHNCEGNRMRKSTDSAIRPDVAWRTSLTQWQKAAIPFLSFAGAVTARLSAPSPEARSARLVARSVEPALSCHSAATDTSSGGRPRARGLV
jgi:hypothetical protein